MTPLRTRAIEVLEEAIGEWSRRLVPDRYVDPPTLVEVQVDALLAAGLLHDPDVNVDRIERALAFAEAARSATDEARIERAARAIHERHFPRTPWEDSRDDARDYCRDEARAALAAADQEDTT